MNSNIKLIDFATILPIWSQNLWPNRVSSIEPKSAMVYGLAEFDMKNMELPVWFFGYCEDDIIVGVNSGHICSDNGLRSRGLWVHEKYRRAGIGRMLLEETIQLARLQKCSYIWSYPRRSSWSTYYAAGFSLTSHWQASETSEANAYCRLVLT